MCLPGCPSGKPSGELPAAFRIALKKIDNPQDCMPSGRAFWEAFRLVEKLPACFPACLPGLPEDPLLDFFVWLASVSMHVAHNNSNRGNRWLNGGLTGRPAEVVPSEGLLEDIPEGCHSQAFWPFLCIAYQKAVTMNCSSSCSRPILMCVDQ